MTRAGARAEVHIWSRYGWIEPSRAYTKRLESPDYYGLNLRRETFDPMLRHSAGTEGVELMLGHTATALLRDTEGVGGVKVRSRDGDERELRAGLVAGADGRGSRIAALAGQRTRVRANNRFVYYALFRHHPTGDRKQPAGVVHGPRHGLRLSH